MEKHELEKSIYEMKNEIKQMKKDLTLARLYISDMSHMIVACYNLISENDDLLMINIIKEMFEKYGSQAIEDLKNSFDHFMEVRETESCNNHDYLQNFLDDFLQCTEK